jgi:hypothetical protein
MKGWLDKYQDGGVAKTDATRTFPALNYRSVEDSARIEREKELARRKTSVGPQSKPSVAMKQAAEERYAQQKRNEKYKKAAEYAQVIGGGLEVAAPFTGPLAPIIGGAGTITSAGSSAYLSGRDVADENYGSALMNAGFGGLGVAGYTPVARATNVRGVNVANATNAVDYVSDVASTYNSYDDYGSNYAQRIQNIRQHITDDELQDIVRPRRGLTPYNNKLRSHPDDGFFDPQEYLPEPDDFTDYMMNRAIDKSSNVDYNLGASVMGMPIPNRLAGNTLRDLRDWSNYNELSTTGGANFLQQWQEQNGSLIKQTLLGKLKDKAGKAINTVDEKLGKLVSPPRSLPEGVSLEKLSDEINKELTKGVGVKKVDFPLRINLAGKGNLDELYANTQIINPATNQLVNAGNITLARQQQPYGSKKFSEVLFPNKKPSTNPGRDTWNNTLGFAKTADFPFTKLSEQDKAILEKQGVSGEFNKAINEVLKRNNLGNILSGGTGHTQQGADRWENLIQKGLAEDLGGRFYKLKKNGGWLDKYEDGGELNYNDSNASAGPGFQGDGYSNVGRNYSPAWGGQFQMGGSIGGATQGIPGATGFMYSRDSGSNPSEDKGRNKLYKTDASAQNGKEMKFYQEGLDFKPKSISKNGSKVIKDDRGQWDHPGEITEIGSNQITMQGVPYPVMGVSDTGDTQMMYPNQEYQYDGNSVTEYPMMQDGGVLDSIVNVGKGAVKYVDNLIKTGINKLSAMDEPDPNIAIAAAEVESRRMKEKFMKERLAMESGFSKFSRLREDHPKTKKLESQIGRTEWNSDGYNKSYQIDKNKVKLNTGRFTGANVSSKLIDDLAEAAKRNNIPIGQMLALAARESTFGEQKGQNFNYEKKNIYTSGWDVANDYTPYEALRFLADKKVPGVNVNKSRRSWTYDIDDENKINSYLNSHPKLFDDYKKKLNSTSDIGNKNYFDLSAEFLKKKGIKGYNPGDPNYEKMFNQDYDILKQDKALMSYLKKKGYKYEQGGQLTKLDQLTNFTNYNTKQPGGWLDKYQ